MLTFSLRSVTKDRRCARCGASIDDELAFTANEHPYAVVHLRCGVELNPELALFIFVNQRPVARDVEALRARAQHLVLARDAKRSAPGAPETFEQIRDPKGRPRVRVLAYESGPTAKQQHTYVWLHQLWSIHHFWSPLREYAVVRARFERETRRDPTQPIAAAIYYQCAGAKVSSFKGKLAEWRALGLASPVIVVSGSLGRDAAVRDQTVAEVRVLFAKYGFDPDDAPVVTVLESDDATREAMGLALDEQADKFAMIPDHRKTQRLFASVAELFDDARDDALAQPMISALERYRAASPEQRAALVERMIAFARRSPIEAAPLLRGVERYKVALDRASLAALIEGILSHPEEVPAQTSGWLAHWQASGHPGGELSKLVRDAVDRGPKKKASKLLEIARRREIAVIAPAEPRSVDRDPT